MSNSNDVTAALQRHLHALMNERAGVIIRDQELALPLLTTPFPRKDAPAWFPIRGMYGGFSYWVEGRGKTARLTLTELESRGGRFWASTRGHHGRVQTH